MREDGATFAGEARSLEITPTWAVAVVSFALLAVSLLIERLFHLLANFLNRKRRKALMKGLDKIRSELMLLGFISLFLSVAENPIANICISNSLGRSFCHVETQRFQMSLKRRVDVNCRR